MKGFKIMKFLCAQNVLNDTLNIVSKAVASHSSMAVLEGILIKASSNKIEIIANDLEMGMFKEIPQLYDYGIEPEYDVLYDQDAGVLLTAWGLCLVITFVCAVISVLSLKLKNRGS